jgi:hypothetical protein
MSRVKSKNSSPEIVALSLSIARKAVAREAVWQCELKDLKALSNKLYDIIEQN